MTKEAAVAIFNTELSIKPLKLNKPPRMTKQDLLIEADLEGLVQWTGGWSFQLCNI